MNFILLTKRNLQLLVLLLACSMLLTACSTPCDKSAPKAWNVSITKKVPATIRVDLVAVTDAELPQWIAYSKDKYWETGDLFRSSAQKLSNDLSAMETPWEVPSTDPVWNTWLSRGATVMLIIADMPAAKGLTGPGDPRLYQVSIRRNCWEGKTLKFDIYENRVQPNTPPRK